MATNQPTDTPSILARLGDVVAFELTVLERTAVGTSIVSLELGGVPEGFAPDPGQDVMLAIPVEGGDGTFRRRYTVRSLEVDAGSLVLWIDTAADGPGARWAQHAPIGSTIEGIGPRGKITLDPFADWHLFIGDASFLPAAYAMAEAIESPGQALFLFEIAHADDAVTPQLDEGIGVTVCFIERGGRPLDDPSGLLSGLGALELPTDEGHVYVGGELKVVATVRAALVERGIAREAMDTKAYWRLGVANLAHGEPQKDDA